MANSIQISTVGVFKDALIVSIKKPSIAFFFLKTIFNQLRSQRKRLKLIKNGIQVPPVMIFSITNKCNLKCKGCYNMTLRPQRESELNTGEVCGILKQAREVGMWRVSYRDATQALELAMRLQTDVPLYIGDLGVYPLLLTLSDQEKLLGITEQTLGVLIEYDARQNADLIKTLEAFSLVMEISARHLRC